MEALENTALEKTIQMAKATFSRPRIWIICAPCSRPTCARVPAQLAPPAKVLVSNSSGAVSITESMLDEHAQRVAVNAASAHIQMELTGACHFGLFSVHPLLQAGGIGKALLLECERRAVKKLVRMKCACR